MSGWDEYKRTMVEADDLYGAAKRDDVAALTRLLDAGAAIDARDARGYSPLMLAAYSGSQRAFALLIARGADVNSTDLAGNSVLMGACFKGHASMVDQLIAGGADLGARNAAGLDAAGWAEMFGRNEVLSLLDAAQRNAQPAAGERDDGEMERTGRSGSWRTSI